MSLVGLLISALVVLALGGGSSGSTHDGAVGFMHVTALLLVLLLLVLLGYVMPEHCQEGG